MKLRLVTPARRLLDLQTDKVAARSNAGAFCIKPNHLDLVAPLRAGVLAYTADGRERFAGVSEGVLVKAGDEVLVSVRDAVVDAELGEIESAIRQRLAGAAQHDQTARHAARRLEASLARRFVELDTEPESINA